MATNNEEKLARSYRGQIVSDNLSFQINLKWLIQLIIAVGMIVYGFWKIEGRIQNLERDMVVAMEEIELHEAERKLAEELHIQQLEAQMQEQTVWIEKELGINLNPFSWGKRKK